MSPDEIKAKAATLAELYAAKAAGKTLQLTTERFGIQDVPDDAGPDMESDLNRWRVKPEPRRMWTFESRSGSTGRSEDERLVADWKAAGYTVTEWKEVLP